MLLHERGELITKNSKPIIEEDKLEGYYEAQRDLLMCNMLTREALLTALPENEFSQVKSLVLAKEI